MTNFLDREASKAIFTASAKCSDDSTLLTPLLPAESTGLTITGHVKNPHPLMLLSNYHIPSHEEY